VPQVLVTGATGFAGDALIPLLLRDGHAVRAFARMPSRVRHDVPVVQGDAITGAGYAEALDGIDVAYYLMHSMETAATANGGFDTAERESALRFAEAATAAGVRRVVYLGGVVPTDKVPGRHLGSRLAVEEILLGAAPESLALRASIVIGARSRSFRFLVRLVERFPVMAIPAWHHFRTAPIDARDVLSYLVAGGVSDVVDGPLSLDVPGPEILSYGDMMERIRDLMLLGRPRLNLPFSVTPVAAPVAAAVAGEDLALVQPLMEGLDGDLLPRDMRASRLLGVRLHSFDAAVERSLREWEETEELAGR
jgi:uncharacterized protein YbjT (DUF2867 family)